MYREQAEFAVGDAVEARWGLKWCPGVVDEIIFNPHGAAVFYEVQWENDDANQIPRRLVRGRRKRRRANPRGVT